MKRDVVAALLLSVFTVHSEAANLKEIVEAARAGIPWRDFERMAGVERMNAAVRIGSSLAGARPREAWTWAKDLPPSDDREFLMRGILLERAGRDPSTGLKELMELPAGGERGVLARAFFGKWASLDPAKAAGAVSGLASGQTRDAATESVLLAWAATGPAAAAHWASQLPSTVSGPPRELAVAGMAGAESLVGVHYDRAEAMQLAAFEWAKRDRKAALRWAQSVTDPALSSILIRLIAGK